MSVNSNACPCCQKKLAGGKNYYGVIFCPWCFYKNVTLRYIAFITDLISWPFIFVFILAVFIAILFSIVSAVTGIPLSLQNNLSDNFAMFLFFISFVFKDTAFLNRSIGKRLTGLKIISRRTGKQASLIEIIKRNIVMPVPFMWPYIAYQIFNKGERIDDDYTNTMVVSENFMNAALNCEKNIKCINRTGELKEGVNNYLKEMDKLEINPDYNALDELIMPSLEVVIDRKNLKIYTENLNQHNPETGADFENVSAFLFKGSFFISIDKKIIRYDIAANKIISEIPHPDYNQILSEARLDKLDTISLTPSFALDENRIMWFLRGYDEKCEFLAIPVVLSFTDYGEKWTAIKPANSDLKLSGVAPHKILKTDNPEMFILKGQVDGGAEMHIDEFINVDVFYSIDISGRTFKYISLKKADDFLEPDSYFLEVCDYAMMKLMSDAVNKNIEQKIERSFKWYPSNDRELALMQLNEKEGLKKIPAFSIKKYKENKDLINELKGNFCSNLLITAKRQNMLILIDFISSHRHVIFRCWKM